MSEITLKDYRRLVERQGQALLDVIRSVAMGDLDVEVEIPEGVEVLSDLAVGVEIMIGDLQEMMAERVRTELVEEQSRVLLDIVQSVALGDLDVKVDVPEGAEVLSELAIGIEMMIDDFREMMAEQARARHELEESQQRLQDALDEVLAAQRRYLREEWAGYAGFHESSSGYLYEDGRQGPTSDAWLPGMKEALQQADIVAQAEGDGTALALPIALYDEVVGAVGFRREGGAPWTDEEIAAAEAVIEQVGWALESQRLFDEEQQARALLGMRVKELDCLNDIGRKLDEIPSIPELLEWVVGRIPEAMQFPDLCRVAVEFEGQLYGAAEAPNLARQMVQGLQFGTERVGRVTIAYDEDRSFLDEESALLGDIARRLNGYIENRRLFDQTQVALSEAELLLRVSQSLTQLVDARTMFEFVLAEYLSYLNLPQGGVLIHAEDGTYGTLQALMRDGKLVEPGMRIPIVGNLPMEQMIATKEPVIIDDVLESDLVEPTDELAQELGYRSLLLVPILARGQVVGALGADSLESVHEFSEREVALVRSVASQLSIALENRRLLEETRAALAETQALYQATASVTSVESLAGTLQAVVDGVAEALPADQVALFTLDVEDRQVTHFVTSGPSTETIEPPTFEQLWSGLSGWVLRERQPALSLKGEADPRESPELTRLRMETGSGSILVVPIEYRGKALGTLTAINQLDQPDFGERDMDLMAAMANQAAGAIENARLFEETQAALAEVEATHRGYLRRAWQDHLRQREMLERSAFLYDRAPGEQATAWAAVPDLWRPEMEEALQQGRHAQANGDEDRTGLAIPITVRGQPIGVLGVESPAGDRQWTEEELAFVEAVGDQLAQTLETARLFADTQRTAERERLIGDITAKIRASTDMRDILQTAAVELGQALGTSRAKIRVGLEGLDAKPGGEVPEQPAAPGGDGHSADGNGRQPGPAR